MTSPQLNIKRILREKTQMQSHPNEQFMVVINPDNILEWHFILMNIKDSPYQDGEFHGKISIPTDYPFKPPSIMFFTPQGRFECHQSICLSFTSHHPESWSSSWTIEGMLIAIISFMHTNEKTLGGLNTTDKQKREYAQKSKEFNMSNLIFQEIFVDYYQKLCSDLQIQTISQTNHIQQEIPVDIINDPAIQRLDQQHQNHIVPPQDLIIHPNDLIIQPLQQQINQNQIQQKRRRRIMTYIGWSLLLFSIVRFVAKQKINTQSILKIN